MIDPVDSLLTSVLSGATEAAPPCTVWVPLDASRINPRADQDELARTCRRDEAAELGLVVEQQRRQRAGWAAAQVALRKLGTVFGEARRARPCSRCGAVFEAWRTSHSYTWAKQCRRCAGRKRKGEGEVPSVTGRE